MQQTLWPASQQQTNLLPSKYGTLNDFLQRFNPGQQMAICGDSELCFFGDYPTLATVKASYGSNAPIMWLVPQLYNLSEYCGCRDKLSGVQLEECASIIAAEFYYLKISEIMLFFRRFKSAKYGRFYGSVDPLIIIDFLREFLKERNAAIDKAEKEREAQMRENRDNNSFSYDEWLEIKTIIAMYNPEYVITAAEYRRFRANYSEKHEK